jgi:hypothetical protein
MITVFGEGRGFRVVWLLEEMGLVLGEAERAYVDRASGREAYKRAMETCLATKAWAARATGR